MRRPIADEIAAAFRNDGQPGFAVIARTSRAETIELVRM